MNGIFIPFQASEVKYLQPKIIVFDAETEVISKLKEQGYNVLEGSLGLPYTVEQINEYYPIQKNWSLPHEHKEQEIVVIDFNFKKGKTKYLSTSKINQVNSKIHKWWVNHKSGFVDPGLLQGNFLKNDFERILNYGGILVFFVDTLNFQSFHFGYKYGYGVEFSESIDCSTWSLLNINNVVERLQINLDHGSSISLSKDLNKKDPICKLLSKYLRGANYYQTFNPYGGLKERWKSLLINKYGYDVGGIILPDEDKAGYIFIFPEINDKPLFLLELINEILPEYAPDLFPHHTKAQWVHNSMYDLENVKRIKSEIEVIKKDANKKISKLRRVISKEKKKYSYLFNILSNTGDSLVQAIVESLNSIGFQKITDVDKELSKKGIKGKNREDLQIHDYEPTLLVEIKGINNMPSDEDSLEVHKYVPLRMKEWKKTNVKGLTIINFQRNITPLERINIIPFRKEILEAAEHQEIGLMTTFDLHRLVRSFHQNNWDHKNIYPLFYESGRISPIPTHYELIGTIERYMEKNQVVGVKIEHPGLMKDDIIAFELPLIFEEQKCESLQFENQKIEKAEVGMLVGIKTHLNKEQAKAGIKVYRINNNL